LRRIYRCPADRWPREPIGPHLLFSQRFIWNPGVSKVSLDFWCDEAVQEFGSGMSDHVRAYLIDWPARAGLRLANFHRGTHTPIRTNS